MSPLYAPALAPQDAMAEYATLPPPSAYGLLAFTSHPDLFSGSFAYTSGRVQAYRVDVPVTQTFSSMSMFFTSAASGLTSAFVGLLDSGGGRIALSADQTTAWNAGTGIRTVSFATPATVIGSPSQYIYACWLAVGTTSPSISLKNVNNGALIGFNQAANARRSMFLAGQTTIPLTNTLSSYTINDHIATGGLA